jgi:VanZ family protein
MAGENAASSAARAGAWTAAVLWTVLVLAASGEAFSAANTRGWVYEIWSWLGVSHAEVAPFLLWTRKAAHVVEYAILGALALRALHGARLGIPSASLCALLWALTVALGDETTQAQLPSRTGSATDVALDVAGAAVAIALTARVLRARKST